jgi:uncharacterized protein YjbI with pentapeptide repeats
MSERTGIYAVGGSAASRRGLRAPNDVGAPRCLLHRQGRHWGAAVSTLALVCASLLTGCGDGDGRTGGRAVDYFPTGGVSERMVAERATGRLTLDHTVVTWLEAAGGHDGDTGSEDGVDEFAYHFAEPTQVRLSLDRFAEAPQLIALDPSRKEIARVTADSGDQTITLSGETTLRFVHPHAGDPTATPMAIFLRPVRHDAEDGAPAVGVTAQANGNDVATLMASGNCPFCNLAGMSWDACPGGVTLMGDMSQADFTGANLACVTFVPNFEEVNYVMLTAAIFDGATLSQVEFRSAEMSDARFSGTMFDIVQWDGGIATATDFSNSQWRNCKFNNVKARGANFQNIHFGPGSCLYTQDFRDADFSGAFFDSASSVAGSWFAGANLFDVTFDGTLFSHSDEMLPDCGIPPQYCFGSVVIEGYCDGCPCDGSLGCLELAGETQCVQNQGPMTVSTQAVCQRPTVPAAAKGVTVRNADLRGIVFNGADLTNSVFASNMVDQTTGFGGTILAGVDFTQEHLGRSVDLSGAFLSDTTNFAGAMLSDFPTSNQGVNLSCVVDDQTNTKTGGCDFPAQTTEFKGASMQYARLANVGLTEANLENAMLDGADLVGARLNFASLKGASLKGAHLGVDPGMLGAAVLNNAYMIDVDLTDADLRTVDLTSAHVYGAATDALFVRTLLDSADFTNAVLAGAVFTDASLPAATFNGAQLVNASFDGATLSNAKFDGAYLQGADFSSAKTVTGMILSNSAVSTTLTSTKCMLIPPGSWMYTDQDGIPYTYAFGETKLQTDDSVTCPNGDSGPCTSGDLLCPVMSGPFPPVPPCVPSAQYCYENCLMPPCFKDIPDPTCPLNSNCQ